MAGSINKVILIGNVGKDPEIRSTQDGRSIANLTLATSDTWKDKHSGEKKEKTEWHRVTVFGKLAELVDQYVSKGSKLYVEGSLQTRKWQDKEGQDRYTTEVVVQGFGGTITFLSPPKGAGQSSASRDEFEPRSTPRDDWRDKGNDPLVDDEIPF